jgi:hypothetical protein
MGHRKLAQAAKIRGSLQRTEPGSYKDQTDTDRLTEQSDVSEREIKFQIY